MSALPRSTVVRFPVSFPTRVQGSGPITVTKSNGVWTVGYDVSSYPVLNPIFDPNTKEVFIYDPTAKTFYNITVFDLFLSLTAGSVGAVTAAINGLGTAAQTVLSASGNLRKLIFHNPNDAANILIFPATDATGSPINATFGARAGAALVPAGGDYVVDGDVGGVAWKAISDTDDVGLTILVADPFALVERGSSFSATAVGTLGTAAAQIIAASLSTRRGIAVINPGAVDILVAQATDMNGSAITPSFASRGGCFLVFAGADRRIPGDGGLAYKGIARAGSDNPLTILTAIA